jgi:hypothetical protein
MSAINRTIRKGHWYRYRDDDDLECDVQAIRTDPAVPSLWIVMDRHGERFCVSEDSLGAEVGERTWIYPENDL